MVPSESLLSLRTNDKILLGNLVQLFPMRDASSSKFGLSEVVQEEDRSDATNTNQQQGNNEEVLAMVPFGREEYRCKRKQHEVGYKGGGVSVVIEFVLYKTQYTLRLFEQDTEGTKLMWLIWTKAHPTLKRLANRG